MRRHEALFAAKWAAQCAKRDANLSFDVPVRQPAERAMSGGVELGHARRSQELAAGERTGSVRDPGYHVCPPNTRRRNASEEALPTVGPDVRCNKPLAGVAPGPLTKYRNVRTDGYASKREAKRAAELRMLEAAGVIRELTEQVPFLLIPKQEGERACWFVADFAFYEEPREPQQHGWQFVVADAKGFRTEVYKIKRKLMMLVHGIRVREL